MFSGLQHRRPARFAALLAVPLVACTAEPSDPSAPDAERACVAGERPLEGGGCLAAGEGAGIAPELCAAGFLPDGAGGCVAILPVGLCPPGQMAIPGQELCRPVAPCAEGTWGDIPVDATTQYVDQGFSAGGNDGSAERPWTTIQQAIAAAEPGALVAVAAGSYAAPIDFAGKPIRLWGRCPELVEVTADSTTVGFTVSGSSSEVHRLALSGLQQGLYLDAPDALIEGVWVHDGAQAGIQVRASATIRSSLVESSRDIGIFISGADALVEDTVVRTSGRRGISIENVGEVCPAVELSGSVLEHNGEAAVWAQAADVTLHRSVLRDGQMAGVGYRTGAAIYAQSYEPLRRPANVVVDSCVFERNRNIAVDIWGANLSMRASVVRDTLPNDLGEVGRGMEIANEPDTGLVSTAAIESSVVERNFDGGVVSTGAHVTIDGSIVRDTFPHAGRIQSGRGVLIQRSLTEAEPGSLAVRRSVVERNAVAGISAIGTQLEVGSTLIRDTTEEVATGKLGRAITLQAKTADDPTRTQAVVRWSAFERNREVAVFAGGSVDLELVKTRISDTRPDAIYGTTGWAVTAQEFEQLGGRAAVRVEGCLVERSRTHAVVALGSDLDVIDSTVRDTSPREFDGLAGDGIIYSAWDSLAGGTVQNTVVAHNARVGVGSFGTPLTLLDVHLECNTIDLDSELERGRSPEIVDAGGNRCGCGSEAWDCRVVSSSLAPPEPIQ